MPSTKEQLQRRLAAAAASIEGRGAPAPSRGALPTGLERRYLRSEVRADQANGKKILRGYAARFNTLSVNLGGWRERLAPGCFSKCLQRDGDIALLHNHEMGAILGRQSAGNLDVEQDSVGLRFRAELSDTTLAKDVFENVSVGNIRGMSFGMIVRTDLWDEMVDDDDDDDEARGRKIPRRTVTAADVLEISTTPWPAYPASNVGTAARMLFPSGFVPHEIRSRVGIHLSADEETARIRARIAAAKLTL
jgi:HK97 family phage prohead protease